MSKRLVFALVLMALTLFGLSACTPCDMVAPNLVSPDWREILDPNAAVLNWNYTDTCSIDNFEIILSKDSSFSVIEHTGTVSGSTTTWTAPSLDIAEEYYWRVRAVDEGVDGPWSSELRSFFTGPVCAVGDLVAPILTSPSYGGIYDHDYDSLEWDWPLTTCIPEAYRVEVSMDPDFVDTTYNGGTGTPGTRWGFGSTPPEGTQFWWRITASVNDFDYGPSSAPASMFWTAPACVAGQAMPELLLPLHHDYVASTTPVLNWGYTFPGGSACGPQGFRIQISETFDFSSPLLDYTETSAAATGFMPTAPLADCSEYFWRVAAISDGVETPFTPSYRFLVDTGAGCDCAPGATTIPVLTLPPNYFILADTNARLEWYNPGGCFPDGAAVQIATDYDFADMDEFTFSGEFVIGYDPLALEPATQYRWKAAYYVEESGSPVIGDYSGPRSFFTGPECTSLAEVVAPVRLAPADGSVVSENFAALKFTPGMPGCIPDGYLLELHKMADFSDPNLLTEYGVPATTVLTDPLDDCTMYHWSVTAVQDGGYGPESDHGSFFVDVDGTCAPPGIPGTAKGNFYCKAGTYDVDEDLWTVEIGHRVLAIGRNPQTTYLLFTMLNQETKLPFENEIRCWGYIGKVDPGWPETPGSVLYSFEDLPVVNPPAKPICQADMAPESCKLAGGSYEMVKRTQQYECVCP